MVFAHPTAATEGAGEGGVACAEEVLEALPSADFFHPDSPMALPGAAGAADDPSKKIRKPYTITKSRESWTEQEHDKFLEALQLFDRDWKKIEAFVGSKTVIQIRSHAQKYFLKVQKNGTSEHVPPPRPKRKASHPYPQKAPKNALQISQGIIPLQATCLLEPGYALAMDASTTPRSTTTTAPPFSRVHSSRPPISATHLTTEDIGPAGASAVNNCCHSSTISPTVWPTSQIADQENHVTALRVMPDFTQIRLFSSYSDGGEDLKSGIANDMFRNSETVAPFMIKGE